MLSGTRELSQPGFARILRLDLGSTVAFLAIHATRNGRSFGGVRIVDYPTESAALEDALALARAMSRKLFLADLPGGGAKTVVIRPPTEPRAEALARLGDAIAALDGAYHCGGDLGYTATDAAVLRRHTEHVAPDDIGHYTSATVYEALRAAIEPSSVAVQGLGAVGRPLAERLAADGVQVIAADVGDVPSMAGVLRVGPNAIYAQDVDVFAPCAGGGVIDRETANRLLCRVVCGGANNPLATDELADTLLDRDIVYVPDFVANVGAVAFGVCRASGEPDRTAEYVEAVGPRTRRLIAAAAQRGVSVLRVATEEADRAIEQDSDPRSPEFRLAR